MTDLAELFEAALRRRERSELVEAQSVVHLLHFDPSKHPRGREGRFIDILRQLLKQPRGSFVTTPHGRVTKGYSGLHVYHGGERIYSSRSPEATARATLGAMDRAPFPSAIRAMAGRGHLARADYHGSGKESPATLAGPLQARFEQHSALLDTLQQPHDLSTKEGRTGFKRDVFQHFSLVSQPDVAGLAQHYGAAKVPASQSGAMRALADAYAAHRTSSTPGSGIPFGGKPSPARVPTWPNLDMGTLTVHPRGSAPVTGRVSRQGRMLVVHQPGRNKRAFREDVEVAKVTRPGKPSPGLPDHLQGLHPSMRYLGERLGFEYAHRDREILRRRVGADHSGPNVGWGFQSYQVPWEQLGHRLAGFDQPYGEAGPPRAAVRQRAAQVGARASRDAKAQALVDAGMAADLKDARAQLADLGKPSPVIGRIARRAAERQAAAPEPRPGSLTVPGYVERPGPVFTKEPGKQSPAQGEGMRPVEPYKLPRNWRFHGELWSPNARGNAGPLWKGSDYVGSIHRDAQGQIRVLRVNDGRVTHEHSRQFEGRDFRRAGSSSLSAARSVTLWTLRDQPGGKPSPAQGSLDELNAIRDIEDRFQVGAPGDQARRAEVARRLGDLADRIGLGSRPERIQDVGYFRLQRAARAHDASRGIQGEAQAAEERVAQGSARYFAEQRRRADQRAQTRLKRAGPGYEIHYQGEHVGGVAPSQTLTTDWGSKSITQWKATGLKGQAHEGATRDEAVRRLLDGLAR